MKVLIIEDRPEVASILRRCIDGVACEVRVASSMSEAAQILRDVPALDLITVDLGLPDSGRELTISRLAEIRQLHPNAVVVVISGIITREDEARIIEAGADGVLLKAEIPNALTLIERLTQIARSIIATPSRFKRHLAVAEMMAHKFSEYVCQQANKPSAGGNLRSSLRLN